MRMTECVLSVPHTVGGLRQVVAALEGVPDDQPLQGSLGVNVPQIGLLGEGVVTGMVLSAPIVATQMLPHRLPIRLDWQVILRDLSWNPTLARTVADTFGSEDPDARVTTHLLVRDGTPIACG